MRKSALLLASTFVAGACEREPEPTEARAELCDDLAELHTAAAYLMNPPPTATIDELEEAQEEVRDEFEDVRESAEELGEARHEAVMDAHDRLVEAIEDVPKDVTPAEAAARVQEEARAFQTAVDRARSGVRCPGLSQGRAGI